MKIPAVNWLFTSDSRPALYNLSVGSVTRRDVIMKNGPLSVESVDIMHWMFVLYVQPVPICVMHWVFVLYVSRSVSCVECLCCTCPDLCHALSVYVVHRVFVLYVSRSVSCIECLCCTCPDLCHASSICVVHVLICVMLWVFVLYVSWSV